MAEAKGGKYPLRPLTGATLPAPATTLYANLHRQSLHTRGGCNGTESLRVSLQESEGSQ